MTYSGVAEELTARYRAIKRQLRKGEKEEMFLLILKSLFYKYGDFFNFSHAEFSAFKSAVIGARNNARKGIVIENEEEEIIEKVMEEKFEADEFFYYKKGKHKPNEGDGPIYTIDEVERYGLNNSGSYF